MTNRAETSSPTASRFLATGDMDCPPELLDLAASSAPKPFGFVRAIGEATLETARAAVVAKLAVPILIGEADIIKQDAAAIGWDLDGVEIIPAEGEDGAIAAGIALFGEGRVAGLAKGQLHTDVFMGGIVNRAAGLRTGKRLVHLFAMLPPAGGRPLLSV